MRLSLISAQCKVHGIGVYNYIYDELVIGGSRVAIEVLRRTLLKLHEEGLLKAKHTSHNG